MDSVSQIALGAALGVAVGGRSLGLRRAALWGAALGTLPDLDVVLNYGDPVRNMTLHRGATHALFWLALAAPVIATGITALHRRWQDWPRWWLLASLVLLTHPLLDAMTVYGTRLGLPFTSTAYGVGSIFIIDPLYTVPLLIGLALVWRRGLVARHWNHAGLLLSTAYLAWGVVAQQQVRDVVLAQLRADGMSVEQVLVTPTPFNSVLWRIVVLTPEQYLEGFRALTDGAEPVRFTAFDRGRALATAVATLDPVQRLTRFSRGFVAFRENAGMIEMADLRMGQAPYFHFTFVVAEVGEDADSAELRPVPPRRSGQRPPIRAGLAWLPARLRDPGLPPPRGNPAPKAVGSPPD